jgi:signal transduction histidine kinase
MESLCVDVSSHQGRGNILHVHVLVVVPLMQEAYANAMHSTEMSHGGIPSCSDNFNNSLSLRSNSRDRDGSGSSSVDVSGEFDLLGHSLHVDAHARQVELLTSDNSALADKIVDLTAERDNLVVELEKLRAQSIAALADLDSSKLQLESSQRATESERVKVESLERILRQQLDRPIAPLQPPPTILAPAPTVITQPEIDNEKNRLLEIVAHDLKNPLNGIQFAAMMLAEKSEGLGTQQDKLVESISDSAARAFEIISGLLATPNLEAVKAQIKNKPVCLKKNAVKALKSFEQHLRSKEIHLSFHTPEDSLMVLGEDRTLLCCLENLISNAIKFSPKGASVVIDVQPDGPTGEFRIEDEGPGIQADEVGNLFQKFTRLSAKPTAGETSTGLGLHIVHELVSAMQGTVEYEKSRLGGACFTVRFPLAS